MSDIDEGKGLDLAGSKSKPLWWLLIIAAIPIAGFTAALLLAPRYTAYVASTHALDLRFAAPVLVLLVLLVIAKTIAGAGVCVDQGVLIIHTSVGTKRIPLANLRAHGVLIVNFSEHPELCPIIKLWGTGLPGFAGGWFKLRNGDKAVCVLLDRSQISWLHSNEDKLTLLLSLAEPEKLRAMLEH